MKRLALVLLVAVAGCASVRDASGRPQATVQARCVAGVPEPPFSEQLRLRQTFACDYTAAELNDRILDLLRIPPRALSRESVERTFGLSPLYTLFDASRSANYGVILHAAEGRENWQIQLSFSETFFPPIDSRPARFRGTLRPVLIDKRNRGEIRLEIDWLAPREIVAGSPECLAADELVEKAREAGWRPRQNQMTVSSHAGIFERVVASRGRAEVSADVTGQRACLDDFLIDRQADVSEPPVTDEELRLSR